MFVAMRDAQGLTRYAASASDPASPLYRQWLTPQDLGERFGASQKDYDAAVTTLQQLGIATQTYPQRQMIRLRGPQAAVERALGTSFGIYRKGQSTFVAPAISPHPLAELHASGLKAVLGYTALRRHFIPVRAGNGSLQGFSPQQMANALDYKGAYAAGYTGSGISIGVIGTGPITDGDPRISAGDVAEYRKLFGVSGTGTVKQVFSTDANVSPGATPAPGGTPMPRGYGYSTGLASPPPVTNPNAPACLTSPSDLTKCNPEDIEAQLDTEQASALAPDADVLFYIAYNPNECFSSGPCPAGSGINDMGLDLSDDEIQQAIGDNKADVISISFGGDEANFVGYYYDSSGSGFGPTEFASLAAEGIAIFAASGDTGSGSTYPSTDPSVVGVGGVNLPLDSSGRLVGSITGWVYSGGGCSTIFPLPAYQSSLTAFCTTRAGPDLALDADTGTGVAEVAYAAPELGGRLVGTIGGTSIGAPGMAAMWALVLQACKQTPSCATGGAAKYRLGNPNPLLYKILAGKGGMTYGQVFYDVTFGNNGFAAGNGFDLVTGLGTPFARNLVRSIVGV